MKKFIVLLITNMIVMFTLSGCSDDDNESSKLDGLWQLTTDMRYFIEFNGNTCTYWYSGYSSDGKTLKLDDSFTIKIYENYFIDVEEKERVDYQVIDNILVLQWNEDDNGEISYEKNIKKNISVTEKFIKVSKTLYTFDTKPI